MPLNASQIIRALGGTNATARFFCVRPPSVSGWLEKNVIPDERLIPKAALLERQTGGQFSRLAQWPDRAREIWPELVAVHGMPIAGQAEAEALHA